MMTTAEALKRWQQYYYQRIDAAGYDVDSAQLAIIAEFARIDDAFTQTTLITNQRGDSFWRRWFKPDPPHPIAVKGLYLHGSVGRGKTFLMDLFCDKISVSVKRQHFHHFMKSVHEQLKTIKHQQNPLELIAEDFANAYRILCLDEFMVSDITDAMLLYGLLNALIKRGVTIVTTTNIIPDDLYKEGLQRARFLPAIALIKEHCVIHAIGEGQDFRRLCLQQHQRFFSPLTDETEQALKAIMDELSEHLHIEHEGMISINQREIAFVAKSLAVIWFRFADLCEGYRSQLDYIELAKQFHVIIVSDIPVLDEFHEDAARRLLLLVDELYDQRLDLVLSSVVPMTEIYTGNKIQFEFERLQSRLVEMQSVDYGKTASCQ